MTGSGHGRMASVSAFTSSPSSIYVYLCLTPSITVVLSSRGSLGRGGGLAAAGGGAGVPEPGDAGGGAHGRRDLHRLGHPRLPRPPGRMDQEPRRREDGNALLLPLRPRGAEAR